MTSLAGKFLVAKPVLQDPNFVRTVVLLLQHGAEGAFGLVINRPAKVEGLPFPVFVGGPCPSQGLIMLHGHPEWVQEEDPDSPPGEVAPGVFLGNAACVGRVQEADDRDSLRYRMFAGYSGWGPDQLERELAAGAWAVVPASGEMIWNQPADEVWAAVLPPMIPSPSLN
jgi:putative transcriptional regulator